MTEATRQQSSSRPPVDALQYEKLALTAFHLCERRKTQLEKLVALASTIVSTPAVTSDERHHQRKLLEVMVHVGQDFQRTAECDHELLGVIALDAKGIQSRRKSTNDVAGLLDDVFQSLSEPNPEHVHAANRIEIRLADLGLLPKYADL
jgi:hypothetical protein